MRFLYFETKIAIKEYIPFILEVFSPSINVVKYESDTSSLAIYYDYSQGELQPIAEVLASDIDSNLTMYESVSYVSIELAEKNLQILKRVFKNNEFKEVYINNVILLNKQIGKITNDLKKLILSDYYDDKEMHKTIVVFLENNQNVSNAAKELYLHRNTLNQRLDKFYDKTSFNVKKFIEGYLIYRLLK